MKKHFCRGCEQKMIGSIIIKNKVRAAFAALGRRDISSFLAQWAEDATFIYPSAVSAGGTVC